MRMRERRALEDALREHYRAAPGTGVTAPRALVEAVAAEMARPSRPRAAEVVAGQARRVGAWAWALHAALALLAVLCALSGVGAGTVAALGAALALASLAGVTRSRSCGMAELEAACPVNAQVAACVRGLVLCCADALALALLAALSGPVGGAPWAVLAQGLAPYLAALGAGLLAARRAASPDATVAAVTVAAGVCAACVLARTVCPAAFGPAATLAWWAAAAAALAFAAVQARAWLRAAASGFADAPAPAGAL